MPDLVDHHAANYLDNFLRRLGTSQIVAMKIVMRICSDCRE